MAGLQSVAEDLNLDGRFSVISSDPSAIKPLVGPPGSVAPTLYALENKQTALDDFDRETREFMLKQGRILARNQDFKLSQVVARKILELDAYDHGGLELLCESLLGCGQIGDAAVCAHERMKLNADGSAYLLQARIRYHLNDDKEAQKSLNKAMELVEHECEALFEIYKLSGNAALRQGDLDGAEEFYHRAFRIQPDSDLILVNLGTLEIQRQSWNAARVRFQEAIARNIKNEKAWVGLALVNREQGDVELSWGNLERSLDLKSDNLTALQLCVTWGLADGFWQRAAIYLEDYLETHAEDSDIAYSLSCIYFQMRKLRDADLTLERVRILKPQREGLKELNQLIQQGMALESRVESNK